jgi:hypothetical protein
MPVCASAVPLNRENPVTLSNHYRELKRTYTQFLTVSNIVLLNFLPLSCILKTAGDSCVNIADTVGIIQYMIRQHTAIANIAG